eukprot:scaffold72649_cov67-Attheya_sp.AAC.1
MVILVPVVSRRNCGTCLPGSAMEGRAIWVATAPWAGTGTGGVLVATYKYAFRLLTWLVFRFDTRKVLSSQLLITTVQLYQVPVGYYNKSWTQAGVFTTRLSRD